NNPPGFGLRQASGALELRVKSGRGLPQSKSRTRRAQSARPTRFPPTKLPTKFGSAITLAYAGARQLRVRRPSSPARAKKVREPSGIHSDLTRRRKGALHQ